MRFVLWLTAALMLTAGSASAQHNMRLTRADAEARLAMLDQIERNTRDLIDRQERGDVLMLAHKVDDHVIYVPILKDDFSDAIGRSVVGGELSPLEAVAATRLAVSRSALNMDVLENELHEIAEEGSRIRNAVAQSGSGMIEYTSYVVQAPGQQESEPVAEAPPPPPPPAVQASAPTLFERLRGGPGGIGPSPRAVTGGSATGGMLPGMRSDPPQADESDSGAIATPTLPSDTGPTPFTDWMTGIFDNGSNVFTLNRGSGSYLYANGTMAVDKIDGTVVEGVWTQSSSGQQCTDGGYHGRFRITFSEDGFSGVFGYCDEPPAAPGGFQGKRRK